MKNTDSPWYYSLGFTLLMLFLVLGPFGLPLVWKNPRFSERLKWFLTALTLAYTGTLVILCSRMIQQILDQIHGTLLP